MEWSSNVSVGDWWLDSLRPFHQHQVGSIVPAGFGVVVRVMHPLDAGDERDKTTWAAVAEANGRVAHPNMQLHNIATPVGERPRHDNRFGWNVWDGDLPEAEMRALRSTLQAFTPGHSECVFGVWDGYGGMEIPPSVRDTPLRIPNRHHHLLVGELEDLDQAWELLGRQAPNLWWPANRTWCVVSEIDFAWTYIAGTEDLGAALEASSLLETYRVTYDDNHTVNGDQINC